MENANPIKTPADPNIHLVTPTEIKSDFSSHRAESASFPPGSETEIGIFSLDVRKNSIRSTEVKLASSH